MRDGVELSAEVYLPPADARHPAILLRTPYGNDRAEFERLKLQAYVDAGYAVVYQSVRGRGRSDGDFGFFMQEDLDGYDSVEWVARQPWCNGAVAMDGGSYLGTVQYLAARQAPPSLRCILPAVPAGDFFDELPYHGGTLMFDWLVNWNAMLEGIDVEAREQEILSLMRRVRPLTELGRILGIQGPLFYQVLEHDTLDDLWKSIRYDAGNFKAIRALPIMTVTSWFDGDQAGALFYWDGLERHAGPGHHGHLVIGPWEHAGCYLGGKPSQGALSFTDRSVIDIQSERLRFLDRHLRNHEGPATAMPRVRLFVTGANEWRSCETYPPPVAATPWYLHSGGNASTRHGDGTLSEREPGDEPADRYRYDPVDPFSYSQFGEEVQEAELRHDVLVYSSAPLDRPVDVIGAVVLELFAASDQPDTDFAARLVDVLPDGRALNLTHTRGVLRARFRHGYETPEPLTPGRVERFRIRLSDVGHRFMAGHRIRLEVTSSMFPLSDPNPNTGGRIGTETEIRVACQTILHDATRPSRLWLPIVDAAAEFWQAA